MRNQIGRILLSFSLLATAILSVVVDWGPTHLFNPTWPGHAVFHDWAMINLLCGVAVIVVWMLWRKSPEPIIAIRVATLVNVIFWAPFFYAPAILPTATLIDDPPFELPVVAGITIYPNAAIGFVLSIITLVGYWVATNELKKTNA